MEQPEQTQPTTKSTSSDKDSILSELASLRSETPAETEGSEAETAPAEPAAAEPAAEPVAETDDDEADSLDADDELDEEEGEGTDDPDTQRRLSIVQKADRRRREAFAQERQAFEGERARWQAENKSTLDKASQLDNLAHLFRTDPVAVAVALGVPEDQYEYAAEQYFMLSKKAQEDPRYRERARVAKLERQIAERDRREKDENDKRAAEQQGQTAQQAASRQAGEYLDRIGSLAKTGLTAKLLEGLKDEGRAQLANVVLDMIHRSGAEPSPKAALREFEKRKRAEYVAVGIDVDALFGKAPAAKAATPAKAAAPVKAPAKPAEAPAPKNGAAKPTGRDQERKAILEEMKALRATSSE